MSAPRRHAGSRHRRFDVRGVALGRPTDLLSGGRVDDGEGVAGGGRNKGAPDQMPSRKRLGEGALVQGGRTRRLSCDEFNCELFPHWVAFRLGSR
jgi:hypothetical protein